MVNWSKFAIQFIHLLIKYKASQCKQWIPKHFIVYSYSWGVTVRVSNRNGSRGKFQKEVIIPIPLEWGLCSEQGTCVPLCGCLEFTWQRERRNFLIIFSWDVPVKTQHSAAAYSLTDTGIKIYTLYILKSFVYIRFYILYSKKKR